MPTVILARAPVRPTEDPERVERAIRALFPDAEVERRADEVVGRAGGLARLAELIANHRIPDTARGVMLRGRSGATTRFLLGKQAAFAGKPNFGPQASPLGEIEVEATADSEGALEILIYETAPDTTTTLEWSRVPPSLRPAESAPPEVNPSASGREES